MIGSEIYRYSPKCWTDLVLASAFLGTLTIERLCEVAYGYPPARKTKNVDCGR